MKVKNSIRLTDTQMFKIWMFNVSGQLKDWYDIYLEDCFMAMESPFEFEEYCAMIYQGKRWMIQENLN